MSKTDTQRTRILNHLKRYGSITQREAYERYGIERLASRIHDLKGGGNIIRAVRENGVNRYGEPTSYARYYWGGPQ
jgi:hypothetical protein